MDVFTCGEGVGFVKDIDNVDVKSLHHTYTSYLPTIIMR